MDLAQLFVIFVVVIMLILMILEVAHPSSIAFITILILFLLGYVSKSELLEVISNEGILTLALLFVVASVIERTNLVDRVLRFVLKKVKTGKEILIKLMAPIIGFSAFLNNTPIVVMLVPAIQNWCKELGLYPSKFLIPISYATMFGGMLTIIGTSTNLVVHGWLLDKGVEGFSFFHLFPYAILGVILGIIYLTTIGYKILPENKVSQNDRYEDTKEYLYEAIVKKGCNLIGKTVTSPEFRQLKDVYLLEIIREGETISPVGLEDKIHLNDTLVFTGTLNSLESLEKTKNLSIKIGANLSLDTLPSGNTKLIEGVISHHSSLVNQQIKDTNFRSKYNASIIAVHRKNERIKTKIRDIRLKPGDVLLMLAGRDFETNSYFNEDFYVISDIPRKSNLSKKQKFLSVTAFIMMILSVAIDLLSMFEAALICTGLFLIFKLLDFEQVKKNMPFQVLLLVASSLGVGKVIETSGAAEIIAKSMIQTVAGYFGVYGLLLSVYLITTILTEVITNVAAAVIMLPIGFEVAMYLGVEPNLVAAIIAIAASASFATPIGYQTNLIVYGPGGYKFSDYLKVGLPLNIIFMFTVVFSVYFFLQ